MTSYIGHDQERRVFCQSFLKGTLHHAWILAGDKGLGKAGFAKQAAHFLLSSEQNSATFCDEPNDQAAKLLSAGSHPDFRLLERGPRTDKEEKKVRDSGIGSLEEHELARNIKISQVRSLQSLFASQSSISQYRVVVIDAIDDLESSSANALLKNLEEPPKNTIFLLVSHAPERLLPTIRSRCQILRFDLLNDDQMIEVLKAKSPNLDNQELRALVKAGEGSPGRALQFVDAQISELEEIADKIMTSGDRSNALKSDLARKLALKAATPRYRAFLTRAPSLMAQRIKLIDKNNQLQAIEKWREASDLAAVAIPKALDNQAVIFQLSSLMGSLADKQSQA
ncbi:MAG: AAA family ATPase [Parasphingorhabdus sp.]